MGRMIKLKFALLQPWLALCWLVYANRWGWLRSVIFRKVEDAEGNPVPWLSYPAIEFLSAIDWSGCLVLEFGGGNSTLWWEKRCKQVYCIEKDWKWAEWIKQHTESAHVTHVWPAQWPHMMDAVVIDGPDRIEAALQIDKWAGPNTLVILDNAEWYAEAVETLCSKLPAHKLVHFPGIAPRAIVPQDTAMWLPPWMTKH